MSPTDPPIPDQAYPHRATHVDQAALTHLFFGKQGLRPGWGLLLFIALFIGLSNPAQYAAVRLTHLSRNAPTPAGSSPFIQTAHNRIPSEAAGLLTVLAASFLLSRIERRPFTAYGLGGARRLRHLLLGLFTGVVCLTLLLAALFITGHLRFDVRLLTGAPALRSALLWAIGFACVAGLEETLLRGYAQFTLTRGLTAVFEAISGTSRARAYAFWLAALVLSFLFGLGHGANPGESPIGVLSAGLFGMVLCLSLYRTGSLWWALGFHAAWDWAQSFLYGVPDSGALFEGRLFDTHPLGRPILSGGLTGPEGSILILPTLALVIAIIHVTLPRVGILQDGHPVHLDDPSAQPTP